MQVQVLRGRDCREPWLPGGITLRGLLRVLPTVGGVLQRPKMVMVCVVCSGFHTNVTDWVPLTRAFSVLDIASEITATAKSLSS